MSEAKVCPKCGSSKLMKSDTFRLETKWRASWIVVTSCICDNCGYVELYKEK